MEITEEIDKLLINCSKWFEMSEELISVIIPTYNREKLLEEPFNPFKGRAMKIGKLLL